METQSPHHTVDGEQRHKAHSRNLVHGGEGLSSGANRPEFKFKFKFENSHTVLHTFITSPGLTILIYKMG